MAASSSERKFEVADEADLESTARDAILKQIAVLAPKVSSGTSLALLGEAYAWVMNPSQPHGGSAAPK